MKNATLLRTAPLLLVALVSLGGVSVAQERSGAKATSRPSAEQSRFEARVEGSDGLATTVLDAGVRAGQSLFGSSSGKQEIEVKKGGGPLKIMVPFEKIVKLEVLSAPVDADFVAVRITGADKATLKGHVAYNLELVGETAFGEAKIRFRDLKVVTFKGLPAKD